MSMLEGTVPLSSLSLRHAMYSCSDIALFAGGFDAAFQDDFRISAVRCDMLVSMRVNMFGTPGQWRKPGPPFGGRKKILPSPKFRNLGGWRETYCFLELNN